MYTITYVLASKLKIGDTIHQGFGYHTICEISATHKGGYLIVRSKHENGVHLFKHNDLVELCEEEEKENEKI